MNAWLKSVQNAGLKIPRVLRPILAAMANAGYLTGCRRKQARGPVQPGVEPTLEQGLEDVATGLGEVEDAISGFYQGPDRRFARRVRHRHAARRSPG